MYPIRNFKFALEIEGLQIGFSEVSGYGAKVKEIEYREGSDALNTVHKLPGLMEYEQITLKRGVDSSLSLYKWINDTGAGKIERKTVSLTAFGDDGKPAAIWKIINAWPVNYTLSEFKGMGNEVAIESLMLTHEGMSRDML